MTLCRGNATAKGRLECARFQGRYADRITHFMLKVNIKSPSSLKQASSAEKRISRPASGQSEDTLHCHKFCGGGVAL
jgi:hypothetical protein